VNAVLLAPHNDDETLFASYLILRYRPKVIVCLRSERMLQPGYPGGPLACAPVYREGETWKALLELGHMGRLPLNEHNQFFEQWKFSDELREPDASLDLGTAIGETVVAYDLIIYPAWEDGGNEQHNIVADAVEAALRIAARRSVAYLTYTADGRSREGREMPFEPDWPARKLRALACYGSQIAHPATRDHFLDGGLREYVAEGTVLP